MKIRPNKKQNLAYLAAIATALQGSGAYASGILPFTPLPASGSLLPTGSPLEATPFLLPTGYKQSVIVDRLNTFDNDYTPGTVGGGARWSNWDMLTLNETGPDAGRYMFIPMEVAGQGVARYDFQTDTMVNLAPNNTVGGGRLDPSRWTPWGTVIAGDEETRGSIFEITNPLAADPSTVVSTRRLDFGRVAFEGISRAADGNWYYGDENGTGAIFKYVPKAANVGTPDELVGGQIFALKIAAPTTSAAGNKLGTGTWVALNDASGVPTTGAIGSATDPRVDARAAAAAVGATGFDRPEDSVLSTLADGTLVYYVTTTGTHSTLAVKIAADGSGATVSEYATRSTIDLATGLAANTGMTSPDNLALGPDGRIYIIEDNTPGDLWATVDLNNDGDLVDTGEGIGRFGILRTAGAEPTGMYWDGFRNQWLVNVQHPSSGNDLTIAIAVPDSGSSLANLAIALVGTVSFGFVNRRRRQTA